MPFTLDFSAEALTSTVCGGDDPFTAPPGRPGLPVTANGGPGNDSLTGAEEADSFFGGTGNDTLTGGPGSDVLDGQDGDDQLRARDGQGDLVRGGAGTDSAEIDALTVELVDGVETIDATPPPPAPDTTALLPTLGHIKVVRSHGHLIARGPVVPRGRDRRLSDDGDAHDWQDDSTRSSACNARPRVEERESPWRAEPHAVDPPRRWRRHARPARHGLDPRADRNPRRSRKLAAVRRVAAIRNRNQ